MRTNDGNRLTERSRTVARVGRETMSTCLARSRRHPALIPIPAGDASLRPPSLHDDDAVTDEKLTLPGVELLSGEDGKI